MPPPPTQTTSSQTATVTTFYNLTRYNRYHTIASDFLVGELCHTVEVAVMHEDLKHHEIPRAWGAAVNKAAKRGEMRPSLKAEMEALVKYIVFSMWHTTERSCSQPWFLQQLDGFFIGMIDAILLLNDDDRATRINYKAIRRAFNVVFELADGAKDYMSFDNATDGAHALLVAGNIASPGCFIRNGTVQMGGQAKALEDAQFHRKLTLAHVFFMDELAKRIMNTENHEVTTWDAAFGYYAGSPAWRAFAMRACHYQQHQKCDFNNVLILNREVDHDFLKARMRLLEEEEGDKKKRKRKEAYDSGRKSEWKKVRWNKNARNSRNDDSTEDAEDAEDAEDDGCVSPGGTVNIERIADIGESLLKLERQNASRAPSSRFEDRGASIAHAKRQPSAPSPPSPSSSPSAILLPTLSSAALSQSSSPPSSPVVVVPRTPRTPSPRSPTSTAPPIFHSTPPHKAVVSVAPKRPNRFARFEKMLESVHSL